MLYLWQYFILIGLILNSSSLPQVREPTLYLVSKTDVNKYELSLVYGDADSASFRNLSHELPHYWPGTLRASPVGPYVAFLAGDRNSEGHFVGDMPLWCLDISTGELRHLTERNPGSSVHYMWHPTKPELYYVSRGQKEAGIYRFNVDTQHNERLLPVADSEFREPTSFTGSGPRFVRVSQSGRELAYFDNGHLVTCFIDTLVPHQIDSVVGALVTFLAWLPDQKGWVYQYGGIESQLRVYNRANQQEQIVLKNGPWAAQIAPNLPILALMELDYGSDQFRGNVYTMDLNDDFRLEQIFEGASSQPHWSPDGRQIVFLSERTGIPFIYLIDRRDHKYQRLSIKELNPEDIVWGITPE